MSGKQTRSTGGNRRSAHDDVAVSRRRYVAAGGALLAGLAGCLGDDDESDESPGEASVTVVEEFIDALDDEDFETANSLYHEDNEQEIGPEDFEPFGGIENLAFSVEETTIVSESAEEVEVHADVAVTTPDGTNVNEEWFTLEPEDGEWRIMQYTPEALRNG